MFTKGWVVFTGAKIPSPARKTGAINRAAPPPPSPQHWVSQKSSQPVFALRIWVPEATVVTLAEATENESVFEARTVIHSLFTVSVTDVSLGMRVMLPERYFNFQDFPVSTP